MTDGRAHVSERIRSEALDSRRRRRFSRTLITWTQRLDLPEQYRAIGWVSDRLYAVIFEVREDREGEYYHLVTLWKATKEEEELYEEYS